MAPRTNVSELEIALQNHPTKDYLHEHFPTKDYLDQKLKEDRAWAVQELSALVNQRFAQQTELLIAEIKKAVGANTEMLRAEFRVMNDQLRAAVDRIDDHEHRLRKVEG
ncbi:MAG: hypothetical protein QM831_21710 [Kofleriaceae bacterium]